MEFLVRGAMDYGEPGVFVSFEEIPEGLAANVASLGFDLEGSTVTRVNGTLRCRACLRPQMCQNYGGRVAPAAAYRLGGPSDQPVGKDWDGPIGT